MAGEKTKELKKLSISKLAMRYSLDRATVRKRLNEADILPSETNAKETLYELTDEIEQVLTASSRPIDAVKLRKETADAQLKELKLAEATGEMVSVAEYTQIVQSLFGAMHKKLAVQLPKSVSAKLIKSATQKDMSAILTHEISKVFTDLRSDYKSFLDKKTLSETK